MKDSGFIHSLIDRGDRGYHNLYIGKTTKVNKTYYLSNYIKINRYPNVDYLFQKNNLYKYYYLMKNYFKEDFNYMLKHIIIHLIKILLSINLKIIV